MGMNKHLIIYLIKVPVHYQEDDIMTEFSLSASQPERSLKNKLKIKCVVFFLSYMITSSMKDCCHYGWHPGRLTVAGTEFNLKVGVEYAHAGWEGQGQG